MNVLDKKKISSLATSLAACGSKKERIALLQDHTGLKETELVRLSLIAIGQEHLLNADPKPYIDMERYYAPIGGIVGYHDRIMTLMEEGTSQAFTTLEKVPGPDLRESSYIDEGLAALEHQGEIYPIGGLGSRLDLRDRHGEPLPAALLPFGGRTLLEGLIRDVEGREELFYRRYGRRVVVPIGMMTSDENQLHLRALCEAKQWFGRPKESFFLFPQLSVPVVSREGEWSQEMQPNGHGALWQTALNSGLFDWFQQQGKDHLLIRQINNPIGGVDGSLLSFVGYGVRSGKTFGFASCDRIKGAAEGVLVLVDGKRVSNIEYTDLSSSTLSEHFPANTNILYANLKKILPIIEAHPLQGLMVNLKGGDAGRLESMMQSISDVIPADQTYLTYNARLRTISSAKRKFTGTLLETPEGAFFDQMCNAHALLELCDVKLPDMVNEATFLAQGPAVLFTYAPKLGPLYAVIQQKIRRGVIAAGSELQCELVDLELEDLDLDGSLLIDVKRCSLKGVTVRNRGKCSCRWDGSVERDEAVVIRGEGEFEAEGVALEGEQLFDVPAGEVWRLTSAGLSIRLSAPSLAK